MNLRGIAQGWFYLAFVLDIVITSIILNDAFTENNKYDYDCSLPCDSDPCIDCEYEGDLFACDLALDDGLSCSCINKARIKWIKVTEPGPVTGWLQELTSVVRLA